VHAQCVSEPAIGIRYLYFTTPLSAILPHVIAELEGGSMGEHAIVHHVYQNPHCGKQFLHFTVVGHQTHTEKSTLESMFSESLYRPKVEQ